MHGKEVMLTAGEPLRPDGILRLQVTELNRLVSRIEDSYMRLHNLGDRMLNPVPQPTGDNQGKIAERLSETLESQLGALLQRVERLGNDFGILTDRLDGAV